jgi:ketosteroid isomerase-like protein
VAGKAAYQQIWQTNFADNERFTLTPINFQYQVIGNTGVIWGHLAVALKPKGGPARTQFLRFTGTYVKSEGKWLTAATHVSLIPSGN